MRKVALTTVLLLVSMVPAHLAPRVGHAQSFPPVFLSDPIVSNTDTTLGSQPDTGYEPTIAVDPNNPNRIVMVGQAFQFDSGGNEQIFESEDGGSTWSYKGTLPPPAGIFPLFFGAPCDQVIHYGRDSVLYAILLVCVKVAGKNGVTTNDVRVYDASTLSPTDPTKWSYDTTTQGTVVTARRTDDGSGNLDQPFITTAVNPSSGGDFVFTSYVDETTNSVHVATSNQETPPVTASDVAVGVTNPGDNTTVNGPCVIPGARLASAGTAVYLLYQRDLPSNFSNGQCIAAPQQVQYQLTESVDGGQTWGIKNNSEGSSICTCPVDVWPGPAPKLAGVNVLAGLDAIGANQHTGTVYVAYGADIGQSGSGNQLYMSAENLVPSNGSGISTDVASGVQISAQSLVGLASVAVQDDGRVGVLYDTAPGTAGANGKPNVDVHVALSNTSDITQGFQDQVISTFEATQTDDGMGGTQEQRNLGDYQKMVAVGNQLFGVFAGNRATLSGDTTVNQIDPIFFKVGATPGTISPALRGAVAGTISGSAADVAAAHVTLCNTDRSTCFHGVTDASGNYSIPNLAPGRYLIDVVSGSANTTIARCRQPCVDLVTPGKLTTINATLSLPTPPPSGTSFGDIPQTSAGSPILDAQDRSTLTTQGCSAGSAAYAIRGIEYGQPRGVTAEERGGDAPLPAGQPVTVSGALPLLAGTSNQYQAAIRPLMPISGHATVSITFSCPSGVPTTPPQFFDIFVDPSGTIVDQVGRPIRGATVTLLNGSTATGPFSAVPGGAAVLAPYTRSNPEVTGSDGRFRWDVGGNGFYKVQASAPGCQSPSGDPAAVTVPIEIPPPVTGLILRLQCGGTDPAISLIPRPLIVTAGRSFTTMVGTFNDPDQRVTAAEYSASIDWGDGGGPQQGTVTKRAIGDLTVIGTHTYAAAGSYPLALVVHDTDGGQPDVLASTQATVLQPLTATKTADSAAIPGGDRDGYTITIANANAVNAGVLSIVDTLPSGFSYVAGSTTGATPSDPTIAGQALTWTNHFAVPAHGSISLHFLVSVPVVTNATDYFNSAGGTAPVPFFVAGSGPTAKITVTPQIMTGRAYGAAASIHSLSGDVSIAPTPDTGSISTTSPSSTTPPCTLTIKGAVSADTLCASVVTTVPPVRSTSKASVGDATITIPGLPVIALQAIQTTSQSSCTGASGTTTFASLTIGGVPYNVNAVAPNTTINIGVAKLVLNEQVPVSGADHGLTVAGVHLSASTLLLSVDVVLASARSDIHNC